MFFSFVLGLSIFLVAIAIIEYLDAKTKKLQAETEIIRKNTQNE
jgi:hypothetical protein